jgi:hypothetical protein
MGMLAAHHERGVWKVSARRSCKDKAEACNERGTGPMILLPLRVAIPIGSWTTGPSATGIKTWAPLGRATSTPVAWNTQPQQRLSLRIGILAANLVSWSSSRIMRGNTREAACCMITLSLLPHMTREILYRPPGSIRRPVFRAPFMATRMTFLPLCALEKPQSYRMPTQTSPKSGPLHMSLCMESISRNAKKDFVACFHA